MNKRKSLNSIELKKLAAKKENQALIDEIKYFAVASGFHSGEISYMDICIQRPIIATLSKTDSTIRVWNYDTGECELSKSYVSLQKEFASSNQTYLQSIALHPSGFYLAIGFIDKVKIYHLMQSEIRMYKSLDIKNCHTMKFSNGGQLLACVDLKDISIFNSYTLDKPKK
jgi:WD40 repeat protein